MDFTLKTYRKLLTALNSQNYTFQPFREFISQPADRAIILRHDVDRLPENSLRFAKLQHELGIKGTYYFRAVPASWNERIILEIAGLGHEIGYHYEEMGVTAKRYKGTTVQRYKGGKEEYISSLAIKSFKENLARLRKLTPVHTICMHGSPLSRWDSRLLWKYYDYRDFGITGEPYFDIDFDEVLYLTDTGRRWDGEGVSVRDKVEGKGLTVQRYNGVTEEGCNGVTVQRCNGVKEEGCNGVTVQRCNGATEENPPPHNTIIPLYPYTFKPLNPYTFKPLNPYTFKPLNPYTVKPLNHYTIIPSSPFHSTSDIISASENGILPDKIMFTFHPQRWTDRPWPWVRELVWQNVKNAGKYFIIKIRG